MLGFFVRFTFRDDLNSDLSITLPVYLNRIGYRLNCSIKELNFNWWHSHFFYNLRIKNIFELIRPRFAIFNRSYAFNGFNYCSVKTIPDWIVNRVECFETKPDIFNFFLVRVYYCNININKRRIFGVTPRPFP